MKGDKMAKRSSFGNIISRRLSDITNFQPQTKSPPFTENLPPGAASAKDYIDHLVKERMVLGKLVQDKNKIIELSGIEVQNLRNCLQKMQLQNWSLAQSNSHMLAELHLGRERLKALHHEVACKEALLKAKNSLLKEPETVAEEPETSEDTRSRRLSKSRSLGSSAISHQRAEKEAVVSIGKRRCFRRQSASSRIRHEEPTDHLFEIDDGKFPVVVPSNTPTRGNHEPGLEAEARRTLIGRPMRRAVEKVRSYKEMPANVKMRRSE